MKKTLVIMSVLMVLASMSALAYYNPCWCTDSVWDYIEEHEDNWGSSTSVSYSDGGGISKRALGTVLMQNKSYFYYNENYGVLQRLMDRVAYLEEHCVLKD